MRIPGNFFIRSRPFRTKNGSGLMNPSKAEPNDKGIFKRSPSRFRPASGSPHQIGVQEGPSAPGRKPLFKEPG
ncbi:MAG: hypothetical protein C6P37_07280 [Caldibacillus debilis]|uniref:Uncharacterized protein n=1 Tax=Caldibacillus debilis TaxID=301148 RepID=A0A3E0K5T9_9BACI|nr:MAG: hypothetical protein C6W57_11390 [Caldibacillus debilis]REJ29031.1 MAG: hypothetical protein C6P37_07280 [Caldibacillus debilis]REJ30948.1 MAG: hypothetical protein C6W56_01065 [Caldibacillus debilis]